MTMTSFILCCLNYSTELVIKCIHCQDAQKSLPHLDKQFSCLVINKKELLLVNNVLSSKIMVIYFLVVVDYLFF